MKTRALAVIACLAPASALAQQAPRQTAQAHHMEMDGPPATLRLPIATGQDAFAAIQEIVGILAADPKTDWSKVDIDALRRHLVDMNAVTLSANVANTPIEGGMRFDVTGEGPVRESIRRMVTAHAAMMDGLNGWTLQAAEIAGGASLTVRAPPRDADKLKGLGFFGVLTLGMHHQMHHMMIARGANPHE